MLWWIASFGVFLGFGLIAFLSLLFTGVLVCADCALLFYWCWFGCVGLFWCWIWWFLVGCVFRGAGAFLVFTYFVFRVLVLRFLAVICGCWFSVVWCVVVGFARAVLVGGVCEVGFRVFVGLVFECLRVWCFGGLLSFEWLVGFVWLLTLVLGGAGLRFLTGWGWWFPVVCVCYMAGCELVSYRWVGEVVSRVGGCGFGVVLGCCGGGFIEWLVGFAGLMLVGFAGGLFGDLLACDLAVW